MALSTLLLLHVPVKSPPIPSLPSLRFSNSKSLSFRTKTLTPNPRKMSAVVNAVNVPTAVTEAVRLIQSSPATWQSAVISNAVIFILGSPILVTGLSVSGIVAAFLLGTLTWRAFGSPGFLLVAMYFVLVT